MLVCGGALAEMAVLQAGTEAGAFTTSSFSSIVNDIPGVSLQEDRPDSPNEQGTFLGGHPGNKNWWAQKSGGAAREPARLWVAISDHWKYPSVSNFTGIVSSAGRRRTETKEARAMASFTGSVPVNGYMMPEQGFWAR